MPPGESNAFDAVPAAGDANVQAQTVNLTFSAVSAGRVWASLYDVADIAEVGLPEVRDMCSRRAVIGRALQLPGISDRLQISPPRRTKFAAVSWAKSPTLSIAG